MAEVIRPFNDECLDAEFPSVDELKDALRDFGISYDLDNLMLNRGGLLASSGQWYTWDLSCFCDFEASRAVRDNRIKETARLETGFHATSPTNLEHMLQEGPNDCINTNNAKNAERIANGQPSGFYLEGPSRMDCLWNYMSHVRSRRLNPNFFISAVLEFIVDSGQTRKGGKWGNQWNQPVGTGFIRCVHLHVIKLSEARFDKQWYKIHLPFLNTKAYWKSDCHTIVNYFNNKPMFDHFLYDEWAEFLREDEEPPEDMPKIRRYLLAFPQQGDANEEYERIQEACVVPEPPAPPCAVINPSNSASTSSASTRHVAESSSQSRAESETIDLTSTTPRGSIAQALLQAQQQGTPPADEEPMECD